MELSVAQSGLCDAIHCRCRNNATKSAAHAISLIICHYEQDVRRTLWRHHPWPPVGLGILCGFIDHSAKLRIGWRKLLAANGDRRVRGTRRTVDLLGPRRGSCYGECSAHGTDTTDDNCSFHFSVLFL